MQWSSMHMHMEGDPAFQMRWHLLNPEKKIDQLHWGIMDLHQSGLLLRGWMRPSCGATSRPRTTAWRTLTRTPLCPTKTTRLTSSPTWSALTIWSSLARYVTHGFACHGHQPFLVLAGNRIAGKQNRGKQKMETWVVSHHVLFSICFVRIVPPVYLAPQIAWCLQWYWTLWA